MGSSRRQEGRRREVPHSYHLRKRGQGLKRLKLKKTDPRHSPKQLQGPLFPSQLSACLATLNLFQPSTASGNTLLFKLQTTSPCPHKKHFYVRLSQPAHPEVGGATDKDATTNPPPLPLMRKFKQRLVIYPRLCQAPPQGLLASAAPFTLFPPHWPACTEPHSTSSHLPEASSHSLHSLSSAPIP